VPMPGSDTRVVEIRVAGLVGTSGETLLDAVSTVDVAGDGRSPGRSRATSGTA
jgi:hypothetical protein